MCHEIAECMGRYYWSGQSLATASKVQADSAAPPGPTLVTGLLAARCACLPRWPCWPASVADVRHPQSEVAEVVPRQFLRVSGSGRRREGPVAANVAEIRRVVPVEGVVAEE